MQLLLFNFGQTDKPSIMKRHFILSLLFLFFVGSAFTQELQTATFKDAKNIFVKKGDTYNCVFQLSGIPNETEMNQINDFVSRNGIKLLQKKLKKGGIEFTLTLSESLADKKVIGKLLYTAGVQQVIVLSESTTPITIDQFISK